MKTKIVVVIPTFKEAATINKLVKTIFRLNPNIFVVVVDDNSPDGTAAEIEKIREYKHQLKLIKRNGKGGRGSAVMEGFKWASNHWRPNIFIEMDADFSHEPKELNNLISNSQPKKIILASRYLPQSKIINWPAKRHIASFLANSLIRLTLKIPLKDNTNGYRCYQEDAIKILLRHKFLNSGYIVLSESAYLLSKRGFALKEIPSVFISTKADQTNATIKEFYSAFKGLLQIRKHINSKPTKD